MAQGFGHRPQHWSTAPRTNPVLLKSEIHKLMANYPGQGMPSDLQRPTMRRKSSAQNLLTSFKSSTSPPPAPILTGPVTSSSSIQYSGAATPTVSSIGREWDSQSLVSESTTLGPSNANGSPALAQGTSVEYLRDLVQKRIITLTYMRNVHEGYDFFSIHRYLR